MAIPSRQIGWSTRANLLWQISKQLEYLTGIMYARGNNNITANSQSLSFPISYASLRTRCDGSNVGSSIYTSETVNNIGELVTLFNNNVESELLGTYSASGEDVLVLTTTTTIKNTLCPTGELTLYVFSD
jgi:hypothetical protein